MKTAIKIRGRIKIQERFTVFQKPEEILEILKCHEDEAVQQAAEILSDKINHLKELLNSKREELEEWDNMAAAHMMDIDEIDKVLETLPYDVEGELEELEEWREIAGDLKPEDVEQILKRRNK